MFIHAIDIEVLNLLLEMGKSSLPNEFMVMLGAEEGIIITVYPIAGTTTTSRNATVLADMVPLGLQIAGTAHSHPKGALLPSNADLRIFAEMGQCHIILGGTFGINSWRCFDRDGKEKFLEVISS
ncbi:MAG TPA: Mov34/MPN/PAD-1 family protein [Methanocorpusculum sp.]|nr:Mov34/MPN/PAD-1 family protein [Methanocorpusculum sp.]